MMLSLCSDALGTCAVLLELVGIILSEENGPISPPPLPIMTARKCRGGGRGLTARFPGSRSQKGGGGR